MAKTKTIDISIGVDALLENGFFYLEEHKWKLAKQYFEKVIEIVPRNPYPYIGKLLVTHNLPNMDSLPDCSIDFRNTNNFKTALKYADNQLKKQLENYIEQYLSKVEEKYQKAIDELSKAQTIEEYKICYKRFVSFGDYKGSKQYAEKANLFITEYEYNLCVENLGVPMEKGEYLEYMSRLKNMNFKGSLKLYASYEELYNKELIYSEICSKMRYAKSIGDYKEIKEKLEEIGNYKNSYELLQECENKLKNKKGATFFYNIWNNNVIMIILSAILIIPLLFIFSGELLMFIIISEVIANGFIIAILKNEKNTLGKAIFIATVSAFVFGLILGLIFGIELYPDSGCPYCGGKGYFGGGKYGQMVDCPSC